MMANSYSLASVMSIEKSGNLSRGFSQINADRSIIRVHPRKSVARDLSAFTAAAFALAGAVDGFVYFWIALVIDGRGT